MLKLLYEQESLYLKYITTFGLCFYYQLNLSVGIFFFYYTVRFTDPKNRSKNLYKKIALHSIITSNHSNINNYSTIPLFYLREKG